MGMKLRVVTNLTALLMFVFAFHVDAAPNPAREAACYRQRALRLHLPDGFRGSVPESPCRARSEPNPGDR